MADMKLPDTWTGWNIIEELGSGSFGTVYLAQFGNGDSDEDPDVQESAIKVITIPSGDAERRKIREEYPDKSRRIAYYNSVAGSILHEIEIMHLLGDHPNIITLQDYQMTISDDQETRTIYIRMDVLESLSDHFTLYEPTEKEIAKLGMQICKALTFCEQQQVRHRDIKPSNILVTKDGTYQLADFGISRCLEEQDHTMSIKGTLSFMAPEIFQGSAYTPSADLYSLGMSMYRLLNRNRDPFIDINKQIITQKDKEMSLSRRRSGNPLPKPADASDALSAIILKACAFSPNIRYQNANQMRMALLNFINGNSMPQRVSGQQAAHNVSPAAPSVQHRATVPPVRVPASNPSAAPASFVPQTPQKEQKAPANLQPLIYVSLVAVSLVVGFLIGLLF